MGPGLLVLVVGPSGAGKDTLIAYARERLAGRPGLCFARRRITRPTDATENHVSLDEATFARELAQGRFPLHWRANGLSYALGEEVAQDIASGLIVVANGSRAAVAEARTRFARVKVVHVTAPPEQLAARIAARGRESAEEVLARLAREPALDAPPDLRILNVDAVDAAGERLTAFLRSLA
ncbi:phosphonate metabolism protein/1,5-bisphosphokinase (PRPP-forming) PhnN [Ancylobacter sp. TS-1]|nr:phosphonate metabolism protein/1,5-bisphosphokinase (PRPP-forming) PhnN [Ancylobacter sp. TS-1]